MDSSALTIRFSSDNWQDWLAACCNRFRYHPHFKNPTTEAAKAACEVCEKYVWSQQDPKSSSIP